MRKIYLVAAVAAAAAASPVFAQARVDVSAGIESIKVEDYDGQEDGLGYGIAVGYDKVTKSGMFFGVEAVASDSSIDVGDEDYEISMGRNLGANVRIGKELENGTRVYGLAGYANQRFTITDGIDTANWNSDGWRLGAGAEFNLKSKLYGKVEYRYSNYEQGIYTHQGMAGVGVRF